MTSKKIGTFQEFDDLSAGDLLYCEEGVQGGCFTTGKMYSVQSGTGGCLPFLIDNDGDEIWSTYSTFSIAQRASEKPTEPEADHAPISSDGGPSDYYDFLPNWKTWNDFADYKATNQWQEHSFHLGNVGKVLCRWGDKLGTSRPYDARKIVYSGLRILMMLVGKDETRDYLKRLLDDPQFT